jgi:hypothetical protein
MRDPTRQLSRIAPASARVVAVPASDLEFARYVRETVRRMPERAALEATLRVRYPRARVKPNDLSGLDAALYAYRDGRWEPTRRS